SCNMYTSFLFDSSFEIYGASSRFAFESYSSDKFPATILTEIFPYALSVTHVGIMKLYFSIFNPVFLSISPKLCSLPRRRLIEK
ncbi:MAG: hypothetical protein IJX36_03240, partial [Thermoguttaceae bacterium]|nr:hypothetical protein [Thermoguttaceae bacterium]